TGGGIRIATGAGQRIGGEEEHLRAIQLHALEGALLQIALRVCRPPALSTRQGPQLLPPLRQYAADRIAPLWHTRSLIYCYPLRLMLLTHTDRLLAHALC